MIGGIPLIINKIKEIRERRGLSQESLAQLVGVSRQTIISLEKGSYNPSLELSFKLSQVLETEITRLFTWEES